MHLTRKAASRAKLATIWMGVRGGDGGVGEAAAAVLSAAHHALLAEGHGGEADADLQELEDLLETYFAQMDSAAIRLEHLRQLITDTEEYVEVGLDSKRNKILEFNICIGFAVLTHGIASTAYGVLGMNFVLSSPTSDSPWNSGAVRNPVPRSNRGSFNWIAIWVAVAAVCVYAAILVALRELGHLHILPGGGRRQGWLMREEKDIAQAVQSGLASSPPPLEAEPPPVAYLPRELWRPLRT